ncbi:MAG: (Fe-S)-binding protein [Nanoarchaeota archaeon]|nr:(Fe-S)-binding protein [Nanoarchaeota archaeon]
MLITKNGVIMDLFKNKTLYFPGCVTKFYLKNILANYNNLLKSFNINYITLPKEEKCCAVEALESGYRQTFDKIAASNEIFFNKHKIKRIITNCPRCYRAFNEHYRIKAELILNLILKNIHKLKKKEGTITYYDGAELGRKLNIINEPRDILNQIGYNVMELPLNKKDTLGCGIGGGLKRNSPRIANEIAKLILKKVKTEILVTADPLCYYHLKQNAKNVKVLELSEVLV